MKTPLPDYSPLARTERALRPWSTAGRPGFAALACTLLLTCLAGSAQTYLIDFGGPNTTAHGPAPDDPNNYWNNVDNNLGATTNGTLTNLVSSLNTTSSISLVIVSRFNGNNENGTQASATYAVDATRDSLFGNTGDHAGLTNIFPSFKLTGLDPATKYSFTFYASRTGVGDNRETGYTITGGHNGFTALDPANNLDTTASVADITPDGAGEITITLGPTENNNNSVRYTYLGVLQVDAVPPQTPLSFVREPVSKRVVQTKPVTFDCQVSGPPPHSVQWYENGNPIFGANQFSYTVPAAELFMDGYTYSVSVSNLAYGVLSSNAVLTVLSDTNPPTLLQAASYDGLTILLTFDEAMDFTTGSDYLNYSINGGADALAGAIVNLDGKTVTLYLAAPVTGTFTVTVNNVQDFAGNPIAPNTMITGATLPVEEQVLLLDFGSTSTVQGPGPDNDPNNAWNNVGTGVGQSDTGEMFNLITVHNVQTTIGLAMIRRFNGANANGTLVSTVFPQNATRDSLFGNTAVFSGLSNIFPSFKLTGLDPARQYTLTFYASRTGVGDNRETGYTVEGGNTGFTALNAANNINNTASVEAITPTGAGEITISLAPTANNNNPNTFFTYLGVLRLAPYKAPLKFTSTRIEGGKIRMEWSGSGQLLRASSVNGMWDPIMPAPVSPYEEDLVPGESRFFRLQQ